ncbi:MAG: hypothetical protein Fur0022_32230 [Anaerolineales bacterium]
MLFFWLPANLEETKFLLPIHPVRTRPQLSALADGLVWTFKIRPNIQWHDGTPLTAHDIAFTYNFYQTHEDFPYLPIYHHT